MIYSINKRTHGLVKLAEVVLSTERPLWSISWADPRYGPLFAVGGFSQEFIIYKIDNNKNLQKLYQKKFGSSINSISFAPFSEILQIAVACSDGLVHFITQEASKYCIESIQAHDNIVTSVSWSPILKTDNKEERLFIASGSCDGSIKIWEMLYKNKTKVNNISTPINLPTRKFDNDGTENSDNFKLLHKISKAHIPYVRCLSFSRAQNEQTLLLASGGEDGKVFISELKYSTEKQSDVQINKIELKDQISYGPIWQVSWNFNGRLLSAGCAGQKGEHIVQIFHETEQSQWSLYNTLSNK